MVDSDDDGDTRIVTVAPERATKHAPHRSFDFDDAFEDGDDTDPGRFEFNSASIREEFARNQRWQEQEQSEGHSEEEHGAQDTSVSTIDIGGSALDLQSPPSPSIDGSELSNDFSQVSLSGEQQSHTPDSEQEPEPKVLDQNEDLEGGNDIEYPYPMVHIDASDASPYSAHVQEITSSTPHIPTDNGHLDTHPTTPRTPHSAPASSASSNHSHDQYEIPTPNIPSTSTLPLSAPPTKPKHRPTRSMVGPSALERFVSKTRPAFLPPKDKQEDNRHMADWEKMMRMSRAAEEKRRKALQERRLARERKVEDSLHIWERDVVPDWRVVHKNPELRRLWWGGIPTKLRASMWERAVGNALALSKDNYRTCFARAKRALNSGNFPLPTLTLIEADILSTLPSMHIFHPDTGPLYQDLKDMLCAWVVSRSDEGLGYERGVAKIAAMVLINMSAERGFVVLRNLLERHCMRSFYGGSAAKDDVEAYYRIFDTLLADCMPKIYFNFKQHQISPASYLPDWLIPLFLNHLPFEACARVWDVLLLEGDAFLYRASLGILAVLEPRLFFPEKKELLELLRGENKAALDVARRDGRPLDGGRYEIYGVDEETLWERIDSMNEWWKESTWNRLIQRELPDL